MSSQSSRTAAPKFGSFRPSTPSAKPEDVSTRVPSVESVSKEKGLEKHARRHHRSDKHEQTKTRHHVHGKERRHHRRHEDHQEAASKIKEPPKPEPIVAVWDEGPSLYVADWKGDHQNVTYKKPYKYDVPQYRRGGAGGVVGYDNNLKIDRYLSDEQGLVIKNPEDHHSSKRRSSLLSTTAHPNEEKRYQFISATEQEELSVVADFIHLSSRKRKQHHSNSDPDNQIDMEESHSVNAGVLNPLYEPLESDAETASDLSDIDVSERQDKQDGSSQFEYARLSRLVKDDPNNVAAWIQLINYQDFVASQGRSRETLGLKGPEKRSLSQMKIAICEDALKFFKNNTRGREILLLRLIEEGSQIWDCETTVRKWQDILKRNPTAISLKIRHLNFCQSEPSIFRYDDCRTAMLGTLKELRPLQNSDCNTQEAKTSSLAETQIYLFLRLTRLMHESGFQEYALALWQAAIEFYLFQPTVLGKSTHDSIPQSDLLKYFEEFWDEEVPRFGESNAHGWSKFYESGGTVANPNANYLDFSIDAQDCFENFAETEEQLMRALREPGRTIDETGSNDPYHVILSSDIIPILSLLPHSVDYHILIDGLTCFFQLPPVPNFERPASRQRWWHDPFLCNGILEHPTRRDSTTIHAGTPLTDYSLFFGQTDAKILFSYTGIPQLSSLPADYIQNSLRGLVDALPQCNYLPEYQLAFEYHINAANAKRVARNLLKKRSSSLRLWNAYALGEYHIGHMDVADNVISTALQMSETLAEATQGDAILLCQTWIWDALHQLNFDLAFDRAVAIGEGSNRSQPIAIKSMDDNDKTQRFVKAHKHFESKQLECLSAGQNERFVILTECLALLAYLPEKSLADGLLVYQSTLELLVSWRLTSAPVAEYTHQARAQLIAYHISGGKILNMGRADHSSHSLVFQHAWPYNASLVRKTLQESLSQFPDNSIILNAHGYNELRFPITERESSLSNFSPFSLVKSPVPREETDLIPSDVLHGGFLEAKFDEPSIVRYLHSILTYVSRMHSQPDERSAMTYRTRSIFQRAVASQSGKHSASLWILYLKFEIYTAGEQGDLEKAKAVFFQGLRMVPWCKAFAMLAFGGMRRQMAKELKGVWQTMVERELRLYVDLEPLLEHMDKDG